MDKIQWRFNGKMIFSPDGKSWPAVSGPHGKGTLPVGLYFIGPAVELDSKSLENQPYCDKNGFAWWCPLGPAFSTARTGFGIHPDGNIPGTKGCIGIKCRDTSPLFELLKISAKMKLSVEYDLKS
jgi:hypothetical protein